MTDRLGENDGWRREARLGVAIATLLAGLVVLAAGAANVGADILQGIGLPSPAAIDVAATVAAAIPIAVVFLVLMSAGVEWRFLRIAGIGGVVSLGGIGVAVQSATPLVDPLAIGLYALGALVAVGALVGGTAAESTPSVRDRPTPGFTRTRSSDRVVPADGGDEEEDDDLTFPLDDEE